MSRLEKKCYLGSAAFHGLLLVVILLTAAFRSRENSELPGPVVTIMSGPPPSSGGAARAENKPAPQPPEQPVRQPDPPVRQPDIPKPPKPEVVKDTEKDKGHLPVPLKPDKKETPKDKPLLTGNKSSLTNLAKRPTVDNTKAVQQLAQLQREKQDRADREAKAARDREIKNALSGLGNGLSSSPLVSSSSGQDTSGGAAIGQYGEGLKDFYDAKWVLNADVYDGEASVGVRVIVRRDGSIVSATVTKPSGNAAFDRSVRAALNAVTKVRPFPPEMKEAEQEFTWRFERRTRAG